MIEVDALIDARWIVPVEPTGAVLPRHSLVIRSGRIVAVLPTPEASGRFRAAHRFDLGRHALLPGLVNLHTHAAMTLLRGFADDLPLRNWLQTRIWPAEAAHVSAEFVHDGTLLACAEMLRGGVTCCNDMYFFPEAAARATLAAGLRAALGIIVLEFPTAYAHDAQDYLRKGLALRDELRDEPLLSFCMAPHAPYTVSDKSLAQVLMLAEQLDVPIHCHLHETAGEIEDSVRERRVRPLQRFHDVGLLGPGFLAVHAVHLLDSEIRLLAEQNCSVAHCPSSNLKLASGIAPVAALAKAGVNVGIGTDGAASNNRLDVFGEMRLAALLAKAAGSDATAVPAVAALEMATLNGARALGLDGEIGSLVPGKAADLCAVDLSGPALSPLYDPVSHLVYAAGREAVSHVWVAGRLVVENGDLLTLDSDELTAKALYWQERIA